MEISNLNVFTVIIVLILVGCSTKKLMVERYSAKYDYVPENRQDPNSQELTIALISPKYVSNNLNGTPPFSNFARNLGDDFEEMIIAKGFTIRGPFKTKDEMVYNDKLDIALVVDIDLQLEMEDLQTDANTKMKIPIIGKYMPDPVLLINSTVPFTKRET